MKYGVDSTCVHSGDLRVPLLHYNKQEGSDLFDRLIDKDALLSLKDSNQVRYNDEFLKIQDNYINTIRQTKGTYPGIHAGCVGVLCGAGWSADANFIQRAYMEGAVIIAIGSGIHNNKFAQYWTGSCSPVDYPHEVLAKGNLIRFVPKKYSRDKFFDQSSMMMRGEEVGKYPGTITVPDIPDKSTRTLNGDLPENSLYLGLRLAAQLGITEVVFSGVDMGSNPVNSSEWYSGKVSRSESSISEKRVLYDKLIKDFDERLHPYMMGAYGMRFYADTQTPFSKVLDMPSDALIYAINRRSAIQTNVRQVSRPDMSSKDREKLSTLAARAKTEQLSAKDITPHMAKLVQEIPEVFDQPKVLTDIVDYDKAISAPGGCKSCARNRLGLFAYRLFLQALNGRHKAKVFDFWKRELSEKTCYHYQRDYVFAPWHEDRQKEYDKLRTQE